MNAYQRLAIRAAVIVQLLASSIAFVSSPTMGSDMNYFELSPGVIVDFKDNRVYLMSPDKTVEAVDITSGKTLWNSNAAAKPLTVGADQLVCQADASDAVNNLNLVVLNPQNGRSISKRTIALPSRVNTRVNDALSSRFRSRAVSIGDDIYVTWEHQAYPVRGLPPLPGEKAQIKEADQPQQTAGVVRLDLRTGDARMLEPVAVPEAVQESWPADMIRKPGESPAPHQRISIDGKHTLKSKLIGDDRVWEKYQWTIIDNQTGKEVGQLKSFLSQSGFIITDSRILFETSPYARNTASGPQQEPLMVRMVDLKNGTQIWRKPVRDTSFQGPFPP